MLSIDPIIRGRDFKNPAEVFDCVAPVLIQKGIVEPGFKERLMQREEEYPTGLDTESMGIAIPHVGRCMVKKEALAVVICNHPVTFRKMGNPSQKIQVSIIFFPLIKSRQASFLGMLLNNIRNSDILEKIYNAKDKKQVWQLLKKSLNI
ncbi:MAG: PTS sugar transporter subunit IIA [Actinomycetota bacterium]|nr:PTS sugar transporter subunit IIA [Actinomycetota bacterium]